MNPTFRNITDIIIVWTVNAITLINTSPELAGQLSIIEQILRICLLVASLIFTFYKIRQIRKNPKTKIDAEN